MNLGPAGITPVGALPNAEELRNAAQAVEANPAAGRGEQPTAQAPRVQSQQPPDPEEEIQQALLSLVRKFEIDTDYVRRHHVRRWRKSEEFWKGNHHLYWDRGQWDWKTPFQRALDKPQREDLPPHQYAINLYQALGQSIIAALAQKPAKLQWFPVSARREEDIQTAKTATDVAEMIRRNNPADKENGKGAYLLWTQGIVGGYVRYLVDGGRYGYHDEPVWGEATVELLPERFDCQNCGGFAAAEESPRPEALGQSSRQSSVISHQSEGDVQNVQSVQSVQNVGPAAASPETANGSNDGSTIFDQRARATCPQCGAALGPEHRMPAEYATLPVVTATENVPNGAERISLYGGLHLKLPPYAEELYDCPYLMLVEEQHKAQLRAAYPEKAAKINDPGSESEEQYERLTRLELMDSSPNRGTMPFASLVTYKRVWFRPSAFYDIDDERLRGKLLALYPGGCYVAFAGTEFLEARSESMDDYWVICKALDGQGMYTPALGDPALDINEQLNDDVNLFAAHRDMSSAPPILYDTRFINGEALKKRRMTPASYVPVLIEGGSSVRLDQMVFQPKVGLDASIVPDGQRMIELGQYITGGLPTIFGGGVPSLKTAAAYGMAREQALGRLGLTWKKFREFQARLMTLAIQCFVRNRTEDTELVVTAKGGDYDSKYVRLAELRGNAVAHPSADEDFPTTWGQIRDSLAQLLTAKNPAIVEPYMNPVNRPVLNRYLGVPDLIDPDEDNRSKQYREIDALLAGQPVPIQRPGPGTEAPDPSEEVTSNEQRVTRDGATQAAPQVTWLASVPTDPEVDNAAVHIATIQAWAVSSDGLKGKATNPAGYANVLAHLLMHRRDLAVQQMAAVRSAQATQPASEKGSGGEDEPERTGQ